LGATRRGFRRHPANVHEGFVPCDQPKRTTVDVIRCPVGIYGSEGWGFESLRARRLDTA
jgi:hypothetical protein